MFNTTINVTVDTAQGVQAIQRLSRSVGDFDRQLGHADNKLREFERGIGSFRRAILGLQSAFLGFGAMNLVRDLVKVNLEFDRVRFALLAGANSAAAAAADFTWLRQETQRLGLPLNKVGIEYAKLTANAKDTALQGQPVRDVFVSVSKAAQAMGLDISTTQRIFMALSQMMSKGRVQAEEARQQFGEHLPGGFKALAKAAGYADNQLGQFQEALRKGKVDAIDMLMNLPKVLDEKFGPAFEAALVSSPQMAVNRFKAMFANLAYDIGQGGFMREFVGMLRDMENALGSEEGRKQVERLTKAMSMLMGAVRQLSTFLLTNLNEVLAVTVGLVSSYLVLGLRSLFGWLARIAGVTGLTSVLVNPWILAAAAIGAAFYWVTKFGDEIVEFGKYKARGLDWVYGFFDTLTHDIIESTLALEEWASQIPAINGLFKGLRDGWAAFQGSLSQGLGFGPALSVGAEQFMTTLRTFAPQAAAALTSVLDTLSRFIQKMGEAALIIRDGLLAGIVNFGRAVQPAFQPLLDLGQRLFTMLITPLGMAWALVQNVANSTTRWAQYVAATFALLGEQLGGAFANALTAIAAAFDQLLNLISSGLNKLNTWLNNTFNNGEQINWWYLLGIAALTVLNSIIGAVNGVAVAIRFVMQMFQILWRSVGPLLGQIGEAIGDVTARLLNSGATGETAFDGLKLVLGFVYGLIKAIVQGATFLVSVLARTLTPVIDAVGMAIEGVVMAVNGLVWGLTQFGKASQEEGAKAAGAMETGGKKTDDWKSKVIRFGDIFLGVIVTIIQAIGLLIKIIGAAVSAVIQLGDRLSTVSGAAGEWVNGLLTFNFEKMNNASAKIKEAVTAPLENIDVKGIMEDLGKDVTSNFSIVSDAVKDAGAAGSAMDQAVTDLMKGFGNITPAAIEAQMPKVEAAASQLGATEADAYLNGFMDRWGQAAAARTAAYEAEKERIRKQQEELAKAQAEAWARDNANVDRTQRPEALANNGSSGKTQTEKALEQIAELEARAKNARELIAQLNLNPHQDPAANKAYEAAQSALRRADFNMSVNDALSGKGGGVAKHLAEAAVAAANYGNELNRVQKAVEAINNSDQAITAFKDQITLSQDLTKSNGEYAAQMKAQEALRKNDFNMTLAQAMAVDEHGKAIDGAAYALAQSAYAQEVWNQKAEAAQRIASQSRQYEQMSDELGLLTTALGGGQSALDSASATIEAQHVVMNAYGDEVFDATRLQDANTASVYAMAEAYAQMGGSMRGVIDMMRQLRYEAMGLTDPGAAEGMRIEDEAAAKRSQLDGFMKASELKYQTELSSAMGEVDPGPAIQKAIDDYLAAKTAYDQAIIDLQRTTEFEIMKNSDNWVDAMKVSLVEFGKDAENIGGKMQDIFGEAFNGMADELTKFVMTGKADFTSLALSIIADIQKMIIKWLMWQAIKMAANAAGFPIPFADGGIMSSGGQVPTDVELATMNYANGGIMTAYGDVPLRKYARGGVAHSPQMALFGEGAMNEAYVPLPDGRTIPVTLNMGNYHDPGRYGGGGETNVNIETTIIVEGGGAAGGAANNDPEAAQKMAAELSKRINAELRSQVIAIVADELRPGGTFNQMGSNRSRF